MSEYTCTDCGHDFDDHNSVIVPWGCTVVDGTSIDCVNGYQGKRPPNPVPEPPPETIEGVGWVSQVQNPQGEWFSWTQWKKRVYAETQTRRLLEDRSRWVAGRIIRVDWTVVATFPQEDRP